MFAVGNKVLDENSNLKTVPFRSVEYKDMCIINVLFRAFLIRWSSAARSSKENERKKGEKNKEWKDRKKSVW